MSILLNKSYEVITPESAEVGEAEEQGMEFADVPYTFRELVSELQNYSECSCWPAQGDTCEWVNTEGDIDYRTGAETRYALHYSRSNPPRNAKYWRLAMKAAGFIKVQP